MARMWSTLLCAFVAASLVSIAAGACSLTTAYSSGYSGDGTYYGPYTNGGACSLDGPTPPVSVGLDTVAIGGGVWAGSQACGMCLNLTGNGDGSGGKPIVGSRIVFVNNICPECGTGLDLGTEGDGRWKISWKAVPCPVDSASKKTFQYKFQGSHQWYIKLQVRNTRYPVAYVSLIQNGAAKKLARTDDNFWLSGGDVSYPLSGDLTVQITSVTGDTVTDTIKGGVSSDNSKVIDGSAQFPVCGSGSTATATTSTTKSATTTATTATSTTKSATTSATTSTTKSATTSTTSTTKSASTSTTSATTSTTKSATSTTTGSTTGSSGSVDVYTDDVVPPFQSWSWGTYTVVSSDFAQSGSKSFKLTPSNWNAAYFRFTGSGGISTSVYKSIEFYVYSATTINSDSLQFAVLKGDKASAGVRLNSYLGATIVGGKWTKGTIALSSFTDGPYDGFWFQDAVNSNSPTPVYFDSIKLFKN